MKTDAPQSDSPVPAPALPRRIFLQQSTAAVALMALGGASAEAAPPPAASTAAASGGRLGHTPLRRPGPMLPPVPAILLTVNGKPGDPDEISVLWTFVVSGDPPQVGVSAGDEHVAAGLLQLHREFVLNVPTASLIHAFDRVDLNSGKVGDKFALSGLTRGRATRVKAPTVEEAPIQLECRVSQTLRVPPARTLYIADVLVTAVHEGICDADGRLIVPAASYFGMTAGSGEFYTLGQRVGHIGQSVGRKDIRY
jgi:flavin reductase (DIM6/NTAB) family NADH-FMN oxidoreductase RutF